MTHGGQRSGAGRPRGTTRPPSPHAARAALHVRVTEAQRELWRVAAEIEGRSLSEAVIELLDAWAERVVSR